METLERIAFYRTFGVKNDAEKQEYLAIEDGQQLFLRSKPVKWVDKGRGVYYGELLFSTDKNKWSKIPPLDGVSNWRIADSFESGPLLPLSNRVL